MPALSATMGQLRALRELGLLARIRYLSSVSGGARAAVAFTYFCSGARSDAEFLGPVTPPERISFPRLAELGAGCVGRLATRDPTEAMFLLSCRGVPLDRLWNTAAGIEYLAPFGLYDPDDRAFFSYDAASVARIKGRNPSLSGATFHTVRTEEPRPYLIALTSFLAPVTASPFAGYQLVNCENTPLYVGNLHPLRVTYQSAWGGSVDADVGGGYVEPFAFGSPALESIVSDDVVAVEAPEVPYTLADVSGTATESFSVANNNLFGGVSANYPYWPPNARAPAFGTAFRFGDGGFLDNYGLISVLLRNVRNVAVFINTATRLNLAYDPVAPPGLADIDPALPALFGYPNMYAAHNQVFERSAYAGVVRALQAARGEGRSVITTSELNVLRNDWWGVAAGGPVTITWIYSDRVPEWERRIPIGSGVPRAIKTGNASVPYGPFAHFPNYPVSGQNAPGSLRLTSEQINLAADLGCWNVLEHASIFRALLAC